MLRKIKNNKIIILYIIMFFFMLSSNVYAKYFLNYETNINVLTAPLYFNVSFDNSEVRLTDNIANLSLTIKNNNNSKYNLFDIQYSISLIGNDKFELYVNDTKTTNNTVAKTLKGNSLINDTYEIKLNPKDVSLLSYTEKATIKIKTESPYVKEIELPFTILTDNIKPTINLTRNISEWTNQDITITAKFKDSESGVVGYAWTNENKQPTSWTTRTATTSELTQTTTVSSNTTKYFWVKDQFGNVSSTYIPIDNIDKTPPSAPTIKIINISVTAADWDYTIQSTGASDADSKIKEYEYVLGTSTSTSTSSNKTVTGTNNPNYTIKVRAKDNAGNYSSYSNAMVLNIERLYIRQLYQALRSNGGGSETEIDSWENSGTATSAAELARGIFNSEESGMLYKSIGKEEMVRRLYIGILGRSVDSSGLATYTSWMTSDNWFEINLKILNSIASSPEAQAIYSARGLITGTIQ